MLIKCIHRERHRRIRGRRQTIRFPAHLDDVGRVASPSAFRVIGVNRASLERADGVLHETCFVDRVRVNRHLHIVLFRHGERAIDRCRSRAPILMQLQADRACLDLFAQRSGKRRIALAEKSEVDGKSVGGFQHAVHIPRARSASGSVGTGGRSRATGTDATTCTPGAWNMYRMLESADGFPINLGFLGKGNSSFAAPLREQIEAGAIGLKLHEDWGTTPAAIDCALSVAEEYDVQVAIHTDTINEAGFVQDSIRAFKGRTIHTYHTEGAGGGHAPDIIKVCGEANCLPSSTNPTMPFTVNTLDEHLDMLMVCHHLSPAIPEDVAFAESRIRPETIAAEDVLHDLGAISMMSSDSQAMGRIGEVITRTWQTADKMKRQRGPLPGEKSGSDNVRVRRYVAKFTINPAIAHGIAQDVGSVETGKLADLVLWKPAFFGVKPEMVVKGGMIAWSVMGDANASIPTPQPVIYRPMFGAYGGALHRTSLTFLSKAALRAGIPGELGLKKTAVAVNRCRGLTKRDMVNNDALPRIEVDPDTYEVRADGQLLTCEAAQVLPMAQRYYLF